MTLPFVVAQYLNCADFWWVWPCWGAAIVKVLLPWAGIMVVMTAVLARTFARSK